jgi:hypothetical protein
MQNGNKPSKQPPVPTNIAQDALNIQAELRGPFGPEKVGNPLFDIYLNISFADEMSD